jgi:SAM-dependent methyltransferase
MPMHENLDPAVVEGFGREWRKFDQQSVSPAELQQLFESYFSLFPWDRLPPGAVGFDLGCGTGRWAQFVAPRVGILHCIDPSDAIDVAREKLAHLDNCRFHRTGVASMPLADAAADFGYTLGVLHHVPDTEAGIAACVRKLKHGAPLLLYLYYAFDNRPAWFRATWKVSDLLRRVVSRSPRPVKEGFAELTAAIVYFPLARLAAALERRGRDVRSLPLSIYRHRSFYTMRTDALDRFGTRLEKRFTRTEVEFMMRAAGLDGVVFREGPPYWCALGYRHAGQ